jgi:hypothetical protein
MPNAPGVASAPEAAWRSLRGVGDRFELLVLGQASWGEAEAWAVAFLLVPSAVSFFLVRVLRRRKGRFFTALINGRDGRWSTSKAGYLFWTYALLFAFLTILLHTGGEGLDDLELSEQYLLLLGLPGAAALGAKGLTQSNVDSGKVTTKPAKPNDPETNPATGIGQLFSNDSGNADLMDSQYLAFNLLLLGYFLTQFLAAESTTLPTLPDTLVGLAGVSAASYLGKKGLENDP